MPVYERSVRIRAPLADVWAFHSRIEGLEALTPGWLDLQVEAVRRPGGDGDDVLVAGSEIDMSLRPLGVGPRQSWTSVITEREAGNGAAYFRDEMRDGPFRRWLHTHSFYADGPSTILRDRVEYRLPLGGLGDALGPLASVGFAPMFRYRHRKARELLEERPGEARSD